MAGADDVMGPVMNAQRFAMFDSKGDLIENARELWDVIEDDVHRVARSFWIRYLRSPEVDTRVDEAKLESLTRRLFPYLKRMLTDASAEAWVETAGEYTVMAFEAGISTTSIFSGIAGQAEAMHEILVERLSDEPPRLARLIKTVTQVTILEMDVFAAHFDRLRQRDERQRRESRGRPDPRDRGCPERGRSRGGCRDPCRRPGVRGGEGEPRALRACRGDREHPRLDP